MKFLIGLFATTIVAGACLPMPANAVSFDSVTGFKSLCSGSNRYAVVETATNGYKYKVTCYFISVPIWTKYTNNL
jgi:hypothetical protein